MERETKADDVISISLIASEIFGHLSLRDLLNCSLVNKTWNFSARFTLREDRRTYICIGKINGNGACEDLKEILKSNFISQAWNLPFNGIYFKTSLYNQRGQDNHVCTGSTTEAPEIFFQPLISSIKFKYLRISWHKEPKRSCLALKFIAHIVKDPDLSKNFVGIIVDRLPNSRIAHDFFVYFDSANISIAFPNAKLLQLPKEISFWGSSTSPEVILKQLLEATPKLQQLNGYIPLDFLPTIIELRKGRTLQNLNFEIRYDENSGAMEAIRNDDPDSITYDADKLLDFASAITEGPTQINRLTQFSVKIWTILDIYKRFPVGPVNQEEDMKRLESKAVRICTRFLNNSSGCIRRLQISYTDLKLIIFENAPLASNLKLNQLTELIVDFPRLVQVPRTTLQLSSFGFRSLCPCLESIEIKCVSYLLLPAPINEGEGVEFAFINFGDGSPTVKKFKITYCVDSFNVSKEILCYAKLFPNVKEFIADMGHCENFAVYCKSLWTAWPQLETLGFENVDDSLALKNWDPLFTGLLRKDCDRYFKPWRTWSDERLKKLQVAPSLLNLTNLKLLQVSIPHYGCWEKKRVKKAFISEVTDWLVFRRMPQLSVHIFRTCCDTINSKSSKCRLRLKHLQAFVKLEEFPNI